MAYNRNYSLDSGFPGVPQYRPFTAMASQSQTQGRTYGQTNVDQLKNMAQHDPFCRACKEFHDWVNKQQVQPQHQMQQQPIRPATTVPGARGMAAKHGCPMDREELGRASWSLLHSMAGYFPETPTSEQQQEMKQFVYLFGKYFPCHHCADDFVNLLRSNPPDTTSRQHFSRWCCETHNTINKKLGKPTYDCSLIDKRWREGWADGSCD